MDWLDVDSLISRLQAGDVNLDACCPYMLPPADSLWIDDEVDQGARLDTPHAAISDSEVANTVLGRANRCSKSKAAACQGGERVVGCNKEQQYGVPGRGTKGFRAYHDRGQRHKHAEQEPDPASSSEEEEETVSAWRAERYAMKVM
jgi:hypothetical protein